jgi:hypothetical protein
MGQNPVVLEQGRSPQSRRAVGVAHWTNSSVSPIPAPPRLRGLLVRRSAHTERSCRLAV